jgi:tetratricopeptide (TPR) repeat protein
LPADDRVRLAPTPWLVGFAFSLGAVLAAVVPTTQEYAQLADDRPPDAASLAYLQVLTRASPDDQHLRMLYVRHLTKLGRYDEALDALAPALTLHPESLEMANLQLDLLLARARAIPEGDPRRTESFVGVEAQLRKLLAFRRSDRTADLMKLALELERPELAAEFARGAGRETGGRGAPMFAEAGRWTLASGDPVGAARDYREAAAKEGDPLRARQDALLAVAALESGDRVAEAADLAGSYLAKWPDDVLLLRRAADLSSGCGRAIVARDYGRRLLAIEPSSDVALERQVRLELGSGDPRAALPLLQRLVALRPDDVELHRQQARLAEEIGEPQIALNEWVWLIGRGHGQERVRGGPLMLEPAAR